jgi:hypothetical protein
LAVAFWLFGRLLSAIAAVLCSSFGVAMVAAVLYLPAPPGSEDPADEANQTRIVARFVDDAGVPVEDVDVWFDLKWFWQDDPKLRDKPDAMSCRADNSWGRPHGSADWNFTDDLRYKLLVIRARRNPHYTGQDAGYEAVRREMPIPRRGDTYTVLVELKERPHPDVAFLEVLDAQGGEKDRFAELRLGPDREIPRKDYGEEETSNPAWSRANASKYSGFRGVFRVRAEQADRPLYLHANASLNGWKLDQPIEPLRLGERRRVTLRVR